MNGDDEEEEQEEDEEREREREDGLISRNTHTFLTPPACTSALGPHRADLFAAG